MLNNLCLCGRLTHDIEVKTFDSGAKTANFSIAVQRNFKDKDGEYKADFINCEAWGTTADFLFKYFKKGDQDFGGNISGVSIKYKLLSFEQKIKAKVSFFQKSLRKRFELYNYYLNIKNQMSIVPTHRIDIVFTYNLPANELEIAQMISYLTGLVSNETLLERLPFISDAKEENELVKEEAAERKKTEIEKIEELSARGY